MVNASRSSARSGQVRARPSLTHHNRGYTMTTNKPATPLPWHSTHPLDMNRNPFQEAVRVDAAPGQPSVAVMVEYGEKYQKGKRTRDAAYIVHACNAYPELVAALRHAISELNDADALGDNIVAREIVALLAKLGE